MTIQERAAMRRRAGRHRAARSPACLDEVSRFGGRVRSRYPNISVANEIPGSRTGTDADIAGQLYISIRTVRSHLDRIRDKTGCRRRADLTRLALSTGLV